MKQRLTFLLDFQNVPQTLMAIPMKLFKVLRQPLSIASTTTRPASGFAMATMFIRDGNNEIALGTSAQHRSKPSAFPTFRRCFMITMERATLVRKPHTSTTDLLTWSETPPSDSLAPTSAA
ncbi:hypothetical protein K1719_031275 [Acacia pycnantha]|nr:hypothetical protein K1719_031275 [Acacia pycnantha]